MDMVSSFLQRAADTNFSNKACCADHSCVGIFQKGRVCFCRLWPGPVVVASGSHGCSLPFVLPKGVTATTAQRTTGYNSGPFVIHRAYAMDDPRADINLCISFLVKTHNSSI